MGSWIRRREQHRWREERADLSFDGRELHLLIQPFNNEHSDERSTQIVQHDFTLPIDKPSHFRGNREIQPLISHFLYASHLIYHLPHSKVLKIFTRSKCIKILETYLKRIKGMEQSVFHSGLFLLFQTSAMSTLFLLCRRSR